MSLDSDDSKAASGVTVFSRPLTATAMADQVGIDLTQVPVTTLKGVGPRVAENLAKIDIHSVQDLLFHLPIRYEDRTKIMPIGNLKPGMHVLVEGMLLRSAVIGKNKPQLACRIQDDSGCLTLKFFHFSAQQREGLAKEGKWVRCFGEVREGFSGGLEMIHPDYRAIDDVAELPLQEHLTAVYPTTKGLQQTTLRKIITQALTLLQQKGGIEEFLPELFRLQFRLPPIAEALLMVHQPCAGSSQEKLNTGHHPGQHRLAFEELMAHQLSLHRLRHEVQQQPAFALTNPGRLRQQLIHQLGFELTEAQQRVISEILQDLKQTRPMLRLVQGDVGSGKTVVAAMAVAQAIEQGYQAAVMAPTEILAEQHFRNFKHWFDQLGIHVNWLVGSLQGNARMEALTAIANGSAQVVVGTHALFQDGVVFKKLALIVIDEQHRFGVHQRLALKEKGMHNDFHPHQLIMTATPIPRTLSMLAYADLDFSVIDELPPGRKPVNTVLIPQHRREEIIERVRAICLQQSQAYWICTLIEENPELECQAAEATAAELVALLPDLRIGLVHGRLKNDEKEAVMQAFKRGEIHLLVATTVVEVGVDVPNACLMIIENPERLGLAQLHQLRGRVGRGSEQSHCVLLYKGPLSETAEHRLGVMRSTHDGFEIAKHDLEIRGPGEVLGTRQAGLMRLKIADLIRDKDLLPQVQAASQLLVREHGDQVQRVIDRWIAKADKYAGV